MSLTAYGLLEKKGASQNWTLCLKGTKLLKRFLVQQLFKAKQATVLPGLTFRKQSAG